MFPTAEVPSQTVLVSTMNVSFRLWLIVPDTSGCNLRSDVLGFCTFTDISSSAALSRWAWGCLPQGWTTLLFTLWWWVTVNSPLRMIAAWSSNFVKHRVNLWHHFTGSLSATNMAPKLGRYKKERQLPLVVIDGKCVLRKSHVDCLYCGSHVFKWRQGCRTPQLVIN